MNHQHQEAPIAYLTRDDEGEPAMLFFDKQEARSYCVEGEEPWALGFVDGGLVAPEVEGWRPIETAPKDGTGILACWPKRKLDDDDCPTGEIVSYAQCVTAWQGFWIEPDYLEAHGSFYFEDEAFAAEPTHWMPLPQPPASTKDSSGVGTGGKT